MKQTVLYVPRMDCPTEEQLIRNRLEALEGVEGADFDLMRREVRVCHALDDERHLLAALDALGMPGTLVPSETPHAPSRPAPPSPAVPRSERVLMAISGAAAVAAEALAWTGSGEAAPPVIALSMLAILAGGREPFVKGLRALRNRTLNINTLMTVAVVGAVAIGEWPEAAMVTFLFGLAELIEAYSLERARDAIRSLMALAPETVRVRDDRGEWREVPAETVEVGTVARVRPGERIALDGVVTSGTSSVNEAPITGESVPVAKETGSTLYAGTVNERGALEFRVTARLGDTTLDRIVRSVQQAQSQRAPTQRFVDRFAHYYTPTVVGLAVLVAAVPPLALQADFSLWLYRALVLLVIACPCALVISTPVTVVSGLAAAARHGILIKGGAYLEDGRRLRAIALDKTGTLTEGRPVVTDVLPLADLPHDRVMHLAASLEAHSEHPVASAIVSHWTGADAGACCRDEAARRSEQLLPVEGFEALAGRGAKARIEGREYFVGSHRLAEDMGVCGWDLEEELRRLETEGKTVVVLGEPGRSLAVIAVADTLRPHAREAVDALHALGVSTAVLTGDNPTTARAIAEQVGIDEVRAGLLPDDKLTAIDDLVKRLGKVGMAGDGINDAPALARASIGFAMGAAGTDTALEVADVALMGDDLRLLPAFIRLSRATARVLKQNIAVALGLKGAVFALALAGKATLWMAVFADMGASLLVVANGLRLLREGGKRA